MKHISSINIIFILFCVGCLSDVFPDGKPSFKVINQSDTKVEWVSVYAQDEMPDTNTRLGEDIGNPTLICRFEDISSLDSTLLEEVNLRDFSSTGKGHFVIYALMSGTTDTLKSTWRSYNNFNVFTNDSYPPKRYQTTVIKLLAPSSVDAKSELYLCHAYYKKGVYKESHCSE